MFVEYDVITMRIWVGRFASLEKGGKTEADFDDDNKKKMDETILLMKKKIYIYDRIFFFYFFSLHILRK